MWRNEWGSKVILAYGASNSRGVAILIKAGCDFEILSEHRDDSGRLLLVKGRLQDSEVTFVNIYAPNNENSKVLMGGDFNLIMDTKLDRKGGSFVEKSKYKNIKNTVMDILSTFDMNGIWRIKNPQARRRKQSSNLQSLRLLVYTSRPVRSSRTDRGAFLNT